MNKTDLNRAIMKRRDSNFCEAMTALYAGHKIAFDGLPENQYFEVYCNEVFLYEHGSSRPLRKGLAIMRTDIKYYIVTIEN